MAFQSTPGLKFLLAGAPRVLLLGYFAFLLSLRLLVYTYGEGVLVEPRSRRLILVFLGVASVYNSLRVLLTGILRLHRQRSLGAQGIPLYSGKWPGNVDLLVKMYKSFADGYPHELVGDAMEDFGMTFETQLIGVNVVNRLPACAQSSRLNWMYSGLD